MEAVLYPSSPVCWALTQELGEWVDRSGRASWSRWPGGSGLELASGFSEALSRSPQLRGLTVTVCNMGVTWTWQGPFCSGEVTEGRLRGCGQYGQGVLGRAIGGTVLSGLGRGERRTRACWPPSCASGRKGAPGRCRRGNLPDLRSWWPVAWGCRRPGDGPIQHP